LARWNGHTRASFSVAPIEITHELFTLLSEAQTLPRSYAHWVARARELDADDDAAGLIAALVDDGTLVPEHRPRGPLSSTNG
jgi:hypothetical protein